MNRDLILECAKKNGLKIPKKIKVQKTVCEAGKLPHNIWIWEELKDSDIKIFRATTIFGDDLGEWWISYDSPLTWTVKDKEYKKFTREQKLKRILYEK